MLRALRKVTEGSLHVVLGCGGDRDTTKRGPMGAAAARLADTAVLTSDNPRTEDPLAILAAMLQGAASVPAHERGEVQVFEDRAAAIAAAVARARTGDTVLVAGKGHEQGQDIAGVVRPFDDRLVLREAIRRPRDELVIALSLAEIAAVVGGQTHDIPDPSVQVTGQVVSDSREVEPGSLFVAFAGERVDGHDFAAAAVEAGAVAVLASRPVGVPAVVVDDVQRALGALARHVVQKLGATLVALTGSAGKTSTKDLIAQVLRHKAPTVFTPGSLNNEIGLPLTALSATEDTRFLVLEMGARGIGHIRYLTELDAAAHRPRHQRRHRPHRRVRRTRADRTSEGRTRRGAALRGRGRYRDPERRRSPRTGHGGSNKGEGDLLRRVRRSGCTRRERATHGQGAARLQAPHTLRCKRRDHAPVR